MFKIEKDFTGMLLLPALWLSWDDIGFSIGWILWVVSFRIKRKK